MSEPRPTWGDTVRIIEAADPTMHPGKLAAVCGLRTIETIAQAKQFHSSIGEVVYLVELGDGTSFEIPARYLELVDDE